MLHILYILYILYIQYTLSNQVRAQNIDDRGALKNLILVAKIALELCNDKEKTELVESLSLGQTLGEMKTQLKGKFGAYF